LAEGQRVSGDETNFLSRWSQRKREAKQAEPDASLANADIPPEATAEPEAEAAPEFDLASLPKLEELTATTDISAFLRKGVPESLRNAALSKSWALDPAIRNYVNPALEYAYDWNTPGGVPGSSELGAGMDVARMVLQIMGDTEPSPGDSSASAATRTPSPGNPLPSDAASATPEPLQLPIESLRLGQDGISLAETLGDQPGDAEIVSAALHPTVRRHGSAKPID
jgi:hypothetical protein